MIMAGMTSCSIILYMCLVAYVKASWMFFQRPANLHASASMHRHTCTRHPHEPKEHRCDCLMFARPTWLFLANWRAAQPCTTTAGHTARRRLTSIPCKIPDTHIFNDLEKN
jgi:hypothetical protein